MSYRETLYHDMVLPYAKRSAAYRARVSRQAFWYDQNMACLNKNYIEISCDIYRTRLLLTSSTIKKRH